MKNLIALLGLMFLVTACNDTTVVTDKCSKLSLLKEIEEETVRQYDWNQFQRDVEDATGLDRYNLDYLKLKTKECIANYIGECNFGVLCHFSGYYTYEFVASKGAFKTDEKVRIPVTVTKKFNKQYVIDN